MKKQTLLQLVLIVIIGMTLFSCGGNEKTVPVTKDTLNIQPGMTVDTVLKTTEPTILKDSLNNKEKEENEENEKDEKK